MAGNGGRRPGAGRPKGKPNRWKNGDLPGLFEHDCISIIEEALTSKNKRERKAMLALVMPYVFAKRPTAIDAAGEFTLRIKYEDADDRTDSPT